MKKLHANIVVSFEEWISRRQYAAGNPEGLGELWKRNARWLTFHARRYARQDHDLADEALGELGCKLSRREIMRMYRPTESWRYWTRSILHNIIRDLLRRKFRASILLTKTKLKQLKEDGLEPVALGKLRVLAGQSFWDEAAFRRRVAELLSRDEFREAWPRVLERARWGRSRELGFPAGQEAGGGQKLSPHDQAAWNEFVESFQQVIENLPADLRAIFIMHINLGWSFIRIAEVLHGKQDANLVSRPYYKAKALVKNQLSLMGHGNSPSVAIQTIA
jgi:RNA polymerase sigma factor (sigma-70 family)